MQYLLKLNIALSSTNDLCSIEKSIDYEKFYLAIYMLIVKISNFIAPKDLLNEGKIL